jgi:hypothetical protein
MVTSNDEAEQPWQPEDDSALPESIRLTRALMRKKEAEENKEANW